MYNFPAPFEPFVYSPYCADRRRKLQRGITMQLHEIMLT
jgi:hypothetical protein